MFDRIIDRIEAGSGTIPAIETEISASGFYKWLRKDEFSQLVQVLKSAGDNRNRYVLGPMMEKEADRRSIRGTLEPVFWKGAICGKIRTFSDSLLMFWLKSIFPEKYRSAPQFNNSNAVQVYSAPPLDTRASRTQCRLPPTFT